MPDLDLYIKNEGLIYPIKSLDYMLPGPIINKINNILDYIENDSYRIERYKIKLLMHEYIDSYSSQRVWNLIKQKILINFY